MWAHRQASGTKAAKSLPHEENLALSRFGGICWETTDLPESFQHDTVKVQMSTGRPWWNIWHVGLQIDMWL